MIINQQICIRQTHNSLPYLFQNAHVHILMFHTLYNYTMKSLQSLSHLWREIRQRLSCYCHRKSSMKIGPLVTYNLSTITNSLVTHNSTTKLICWWHTYLATKLIRWLHTEFDSKTDLLVTYSSSMKTDSLVTQNSIAKLIRWWHTFRQRKLIHWLHRIQQRNWFASDIHFISKTDSPVTYKILYKSLAHNRLLLNQKTLAKTESLPTQKSSTKHIPTVDVEIVSAHSLLLTKKSLMKTESLLTQKSSTQHISTTDVEIISAHNLLLIQKSMMKVELLTT